MKGKRRAIPWSGFIYRQAKLLRSIRKSIKQYQEGIAVGFFQCKRRILEVNDYSRAPEHIGIRKAVTQGG